MRLIRHLIFFLRKLLGTIQITNELSSHLNNQTQDLIAHTNQQPLSSSKRQTLLSLRLTPKLAIPRQLRIRPHHILCLAKHFDAPVL